MRHSFKRRLLIICLSLITILGFTMIITPLVGYSHQEKQIQETLKQKPLSVSLSDTSANKSKKSTIPFPGSPKDVLGKVKIPSVNIELPILNGATDENLKVGATTLRKNQVMGKSNYSLAGHHMKREDLLFGRLDEVKKKQNVYLTDNHSIYVYVVDSKSTVQDTDIEILDDHGRNEITLFTCDVPTSTDKRTVIHGYFEKQFSYSDEKWKELK
ncbi:class A sortase [Bacillus licheniformis]|uniref:class A sortase n=1 Tax=Bacillus TaxID=1386 RepID=UPI000684D02F|nr:MULTISPECIES: class A sortase [Bacillus]ASK26209.1 sortase SrtA [Bacillus subtilis]MCQ5304621.1 class A sortase [Bacillus licheniformis]MDM5287370.1 class A sortase [Bacillus licheniformis]MEC0777007.1 class A sortase [Bacillus licheniformis]MED1661823.1 class A sortase [Bacillus licheniformis]